MAAELLLAESDAARCRLLSLPDCSAGWRSTAESETDRKIAAFAAAEAYCTLHRELPSAGLDMVGRQAFRVPGAVGVGEAGVDAVRCRGCCGRCPRMLLDVAELHCVTQQLLLNPSTQC